MADLLGAAIGALHLYFVGDTTMGETLRRVCDAALEAVGPASHAGISMTVDSRPGTYVFTDSIIEQVDLSQYETGDGPCIEAFTTGEVVRIGSTVDTDRYPVFCAEASASGLLSVMSLPMVASDERVGSLNLYATTEHAFDDVAMKVGEQFASQAAFLLVNARAYWDARTLSENLARAMEMRAEIEQAKGIIMGSTGCTADEAFQQLVEQSQHENVKLRDLAVEVVRRTRRDR